MIASRWVRAAFAAWVLLLVVVCVYPALKPFSSIYPTFARAGTEFAASRKLYDVPHPHTDNFRYSPLVAAGFVPFGELPLNLGGMIWRLLNAAILLTGLMAWARQVCPHIPVSAILLLSVPLSMGCLHNGQANPFVLGLMLWGTVMSAKGRWELGAILIAGAGLFKIYPLALGLLLVLAAPLRFGIPLVLAIVGGLALPYAFHDGDYVTEQYLYWIANLSGDDRTQFPLYAGYQDFHMLLRVIGIQLPLDSYRLIQVAAGAATAVVIGWQLRQEVDRRQVALNAFALGVGWMTVFGPSTEVCTFSLLAPFFARELLDRVGQPRWAFTVAVCGAGLFGLGIVALWVPHAIHRPIIVLGVYPLAALLLSMAVVTRVLATPSTARLPRHSKATTPIPVPSDAEAGRPVEFDRLHECC